MIKENWSGVLVVERKIEEIGVDKSLLIVDDDEPFLRRLAKAMEKRGFEVEPDQLLQVAQFQQPVHLPMR